MDITQIPRATVRDRLICIPQDPLLFPKSFQFNLDPNEQFSDPQALINVLQLVGLWNLVSERGGLSTIVELGSLSQGEQQLLVLARAILRKRAAGGAQCILVLDEATSSVDSATEDRIMAIVKEEFKENTIVMVAHRLDLIRDSDVVVVLENGRVLKSGLPEEVL